jgi:hypothetical protein
MYTDTRDTVKKLPGYPVQNSLSIWEFPSLREGCRQWEIVYDIV